ncbi:hypothetical protein FQA39_LY05432 [Lamprigera yunnana]|nr:hypothetical protein FQA39_LY05432 [Lamprigera yunnana]
MVSVNHNLIDLRLKGSNLLNSDEYLTRKEKGTGIQLRVVGDNAIPAFWFYGSSQPRFPLEALSEAASALNADNSDIEDDVTETTSADIGDCDLWVPKDVEEGEENEEDEKNVENKAIAK